MSPFRRPVVGEVYKRELLHSEATYRIVGVDEEHVEVEAVDVPGLPEGFRMKLTADAVAAMAPADEAPAAVCSDTPAARDERAAERRLRLA